ncbi:MAG: lytic transglycosylase domain-containing protein [Verrucomicrobia bacterium]|nr:lytic transglycosylase domain-containing protein [Verrucomicrobiota bacterium]
MDSHRTPALNSRGHRETGWSHAVWSFRVAGPALAMFAMATVFAVARGSSVPAPVAEATRITWSDILAEGAAGAPVAEASPVLSDQRALAEYLAKRYRVAQEAAGEYVAAAYRAGEEQGADPLLILSVMAVESRFNPVAESVAGARGLMQVLPKYHQEKLVPHGGDAALLNPGINIQVGTRILIECMRRGGGLEGGLQLYGGFPDDAGAPYAAKVLGERARLAQELVRQRRAAA